MENRLWNPLRYSAVRSWLMGLRNKLSVKLTFSGFLFCALLILILPLRWLIASVFAAVFHEICHIAAVKLCGKKVEHIWLCDNGLTMETPDLLPWQELVCSMAGPAGSLFVLGFARRFPVLGICALVQGVFNLLPIYPLDGGRALKCATQMIWGVKGQTVFMITQIVVFAVIILSVCYFSISLGLYTEMGLLLIFLAAKLRNVLWLIFKRNLL